MLTLMQVFVVKIKKKMSKPRKKDKKLEAPFKEPLINNVIQK